jgi:hypothetical protein
MATTPPLRSRSRTVRIVQRRLSLVRLIIALFVARIVVTVAEIAESRLTVFSAVISVAIGLEAWRAWRVAHAARQPGAEEPPAPPDSVWDRILAPIERRGPVVLYVLTAAFVVAYAAVLATGADADTLLDITVIARELTTFAIIGVLLAGYLSTRDPR